MSLEWTQCGFLFADWREASGGGELGYNINNIGEEMEELSESSGEDVQFSQQEVVWAKITGYPWWPALITAEPAPGSNAFRVDFFADNTHAFVARSKLAKYEVLRREVDLHKHMKKGLRRAIASADQAIRDRFEVSLSFLHAQQAVEGLAPTQKQLLQPPFIDSTPLQEKERKEQHAAPHPHPPATLEQQPHHEQELSHESEQSQQPTVKYSLEKRQKYVNYLLKKYELDNLKQEEDRLPHRLSARHKERNSRRREYPRREKGKTKKIGKHHHHHHHQHQQQQEERPSLMFMLSRRLHRFLKEKVGLCESQRKAIVVSLARQVETHHPRMENAVEEVTKLLKWLQITPANTIADYYESWSSFQTEKEKASNMTNEE